MSRAPYKYLDYYTFDDAELFFGREEETQKMVGEILSTRLLVLFSPSGSGKTSLINAGVRPALEKLGYETVYVRLDKDPIPSVQSAVAEALALSNNENNSHSESRSRDEESLSISQVPASKEISRFARNDSDDDIQNDDLYSFLKNAATRAGKPLVIFIDQFEEFFIVFENKQEARRKFIEQVAKIKYDDTLPVFLVFSLREDYFANLHEFREAIPSIFQNNANIRLEPFTEAEARRAIEEPAKVVGCEYEAGLVERMLQDLKNGKPGIEPITLQIVCNAVWEEKSAQVQRLTFADYKAAGGAEHILSNYVSCFLDKLSARRQSLIAKIFAALKTPDDTKRYRTFEDLQATLKLSPSRLKRGLDQLVAFNLLRQEQRAGTYWYEFKHDYLVGEITDWLRQRKERINRNRLVYAVTPGVVLFLGLFAYIFYQYNTFYAGFINPQYPEMREEIAIFRGIDVFSDTISTGLLINDIRTHNDANDLREKFKLEFWKRKKWQRLAEKINLSVGGKFLYKIGQIQAGLDSLAAALKAQDYNVRLDAAAALGNLGYSNNRAINVLIAALYSIDNDVYSQALTILISLGKSDDRVIDALITVLKDTKEGIAQGNARRCAAEALGNLGHNDGRVIIALLEAFTDKDPDLRASIANALGNLAYDNEQVITALLINLKNKYSSVREKAASALGNLGRRDERISIALMMAARRDSRSYVRLEAVVALGKLEKDEKWVIDGLLGVLTDQDEQNRDVRLQDWDVRLQAATVLINLGQHNEDILNTLATALKIDYPYAQSYAAPVLINLCKSDKRAMGALLNLLKDGNQYAKELAAIGLSHLGYRDEIVIAILASVLKNHDWRVLSQVIISLVNLGRTDDRAISLLEVSLNHLDSNVRSRAAAALVNLGHSDGRVISALFAALKDNESDVRSLAAAALGNLRQNNDRVQTDKVISVLIAALKDKDSNVRTEAAAALGKLLRSKPDDELFVLLANNLSGYRTAAAQALAQKDIPIDSTLQVIAKFKEDERPWVRLGAWEAYELLEPRREAEKKSAEFLHEADSLFASGKWQVASGKYEAAFEKNPKVTRTDSLNAARAKFQQARCAAKLKRLVPALDDLKIAFEYNPTLRETLQVELAHPNNDWAILQGNWYLREVLLKKR